MFDLKNYNAVYYPAKSNQPLNILVDYDLDDEDGYPVRVTSQSDTFSLSGKYLNTDVNPCIFPYSSEWYNKLKAIYPDLQPCEPDYRAVIKNILANCDVVVCKMSYDSFDNAIASNAVFATHRNTILNDSIYYVPVNPYTLKPCNSDMDYYVLPDLHIPPINPTGDH